MYTHRFLCTYFFFVLQSNKVYVPRLWIWFHIFHFLSFSSYFAFILHFSSIFFFFSFILLSIDFVVVRNIKKILLTNFLLLKTFSVWSMMIFLGHLWPDEQWTKSKPIEMKFDDKLLPSENDLSQNEYKAACFFCYFGRILAHACTQMKTFMRLFSMSIVCLHVCFLMLPIMLYEL